MAKDIKPKLKKIGDYLKLEEDVEFIISEYQQAYSRGINNCDKLWQDINDLEDIRIADIISIFMLDNESRGSLLDLEQFKTTFSNQMKSTERNETKKRPVDLVETFNYLIGLSVVRQSAVSYFRSEPDTAGNYEGAEKLMKDDGEEFG